ncbi:alpha/beta hydrolase [Actinomadura parmotrematis]|uniref:Alpha/beta hydrolase n=1 Tax=Actinomadura parmotrematis TaxID=2864039 RepID=A0ABS7G162_9ACTN|nr:alpha/beta hydrolase [Actinomadura parmotrematis]MBW8486449.1 alpha/beta hydrolase [Actinomadura parmotrematis]
MRTRILLAALGLVVAASAPAPAPAAVAGTRAAGCRSTAFDVDLGPAGPARVTGVRCGPPGGTVQVLVPGLTYDSRYWLRRPAPDLPSYAAAMAAAGIATVALDRPGTGGGTRPDAAAVGLDASVAAVHRVVAVLRAEGRRTVVLAGHSFGSGVALAEAARYGDVDGVIATAFLHGAGPSGFGFLSSLHPASEDPVLAPENPPAGYETTKPGTRDALFYTADDSDAATRAADEATKSTVTSGERADASKVVSDIGLTRSVRVPVLLADGQDDALLCGIPGCFSADYVRAFESLFYDARTGPTVFLLPGAGHALGLHRNAPLFFRTAVRWTEGIG